jgi:DNA-binding transcriptional ArsR family regulator
MCNISSHSAGGASAQAVAEAAGYAKRNVSETLTALVASGLVTVYELGNGHRYNLEIPRWSQFLGLTQANWPTHRNWIQLLRVLRRLDRWLLDPRLDQLTPYLLASEARSLLGEIEADLGAAGVALSPGAGAPGEQYWETFTAAVQRALASLDAP